jgi:DNA mismatch endonuclease (patch repair protein)
MTDKLTHEERSALMSKIKGKDTKPEIIVRKFLFSKGFRYRIHDPRYPGSPDIILPRYKTAVFVNGCFWHGHKDCKAAHIPESNREYWENKIERNRKRDVRKNRLLKAEGWRVIVVWECKLGRKESRGRELDRLAKKIIEGDNGG